MSKILNEDGIEKSYGNIIHQNITINPNECTYRNDEVLRILDTDGNYIWAKHYSGYEDTNYLGGYYLTRSQVQNVTVDVTNPIVEYELLEEDPTTGYKYWLERIIHTKSIYQLAIDGTVETFTETYQDTDSSAFTQFGEYLVTGPAQITSYTELDYIDESYHEGFDYPG